GVGAGGRLAPEPPARMSDGRNTLESPRLHFADLARVASVGLRTRRMRAALSALGIAIGVAAIVAVLGLSSSSQAGLLAQIDKLGTNLLTVQTEQTLFGDTAELPPAAHGRRNDRRGDVSQPRDGARAGGRARLRGSATTRHRPPVPRRARLAGR